MNHSATTIFFFVFCIDLTFAMVQPLTYNDIDSKIRGRFLSISPSILNPCPRTELWNQNDV